MGKGMVISESSVKVRCKNLFILMFMNSIKISYPKCQMKTLVNFRVVISYKIGDIPNFFRKQISNLSVLLLLFYSITVFLKCCLVDSRINVYSRYRLITAAQPEK